MDIEDLEDKIEIGVSACLLGDQVRYDGGHKRNNYISDSLSMFFSFRRFCPEVDIGLGIPRPTIRLEKRENKIRCVSSQDSALDYTDALTQSANDQREWQKGISAYILKNRSPSCGMERVKVFENGHPSNTGVGIFAKQLMENFPNLPVEEEGRLEDPVIRENFVQRVIIYHRWQELGEKVFLRKTLTDFHGKHKLVLMSHDQDLCRSLGADLSRLKESDAGLFSEEYFQRFMSILKIKATIKNHVNVLQHVQGYLKRDLSLADKKELTETIHDYRLGRLPLIVPITLLRHHFRHHPNDYIKNSFYMKPHPKELMLLNSI